MVVLTERSPAIHVETLEGQEEALTGLLRPPVKS